MDSDPVSIIMDEFAGFLAAIAKLKEAQRWEEVISLVGIRLGRLMGVNRSEFRKLTETGLFAQLVRNGPMATVWVPYKQIMLIALLKEAGDYASIRFPPDGGYGWYLRGLNLLLDALAHEEMQLYSHLAPTVEVMVTSLGDAPLPKATLTRLIREYKRRGMSHDVIGATIRMIEKKTKK
jgi:hypothetical protein